MKEEHPFYCKKKNCHKTAWNTPEYLTPEDWKYVEYILNIFENGNYLRIYNAFYSDGQTIKQTKTFFYRIIGWPEGYVYCHDINYLKGLGGSCLKHDLPLLKEALKNHLVRLDNPVKVSKV